jgi:hypothetical protein
MKRIITKKIDSNNETPVEAADGEVAESESGIDRHKSRSKL